MPPCACGRRPCGPTVAARAHAPPPTWRSRGRARHALLRSPPMGHPGGDVALAARGHPRERRDPVQLVVGRRLPPHVPAFDCWAAGTPSTVDTCVVCTRRARRFGKRRRAEPLDQTSARCGSPPGTRCATRPVVSYAQVVHAPVAEMEQAKQLRTLSARTDGLRSMEGTSASRSRARGAARARAAAREHARGARAGRGGGRARGGDRNTRRACSRAA